MLFSLTMKAYISVGKLVNMTHKFRQHSIGDWSRYVIMSNEEK